MAAYALFLGQPEGEALVARRVAEDKRIEHATKLLEFTIRAQRENGTIIFWRD